MSEPFRKRGPDVFVWPDIRLSVALGDRSGSLGVNQIAPWLACNPPTPLELGSF